MLGWSIIFLTLAIVFVLACIWKNKRHFEMFDTFWNSLIILISGVSCFICVMIWLISWAEVSSAYTEFKGKKEYLLSITNLQKLEEEEIVKCNLWLAEAKKSKETYGLFSLLPNSIKSETVIYFPKYITGPEPKNIIKVED